MYLLCFYHINGLSISHSDDKTFSLLKTEIACCLVTAESVYTVSYLPTFRQQDVLWCYEVNRAEVTFSQQFKNTGACHT